jgi:predicted nucleotidyltransferase
MVELTDNQIADLAVLRDHCAALGAELVVIGAIAYQVYFPKESRHTADIDFAVALDLDEFAELERRLTANGWIRFANREHRWRSAQGTIMDLLPAGLKLREAKQVTWPASQFTMSLVGFEHVFTSAETVQFAPDLKLKVISSPAHSVRLRGARISQATGKNRSGKWRLARRGLPESCLLNEWIWACLCRRPTIAVPLHRRPVGSP